LSCNTLPCEARRVQINCITMSRGFRSITKLDFRIDLNWTISSDRTDHTALTCIFSIDSTGPSFIAHVADR
jgi:hypothetical protein